MTCHADKPYPSSPSRHFRKPTAPVGNFSTPPYRPISILRPALFAVSAIGVYSLFGQTLRNQTAGLAIEMSGKDSSGNITSAQTNAQTATTNADKTKNMGTYNDSNNK